MVWPSALFLSLSLSLSLSFSLPLKVLWADELVPANQTQAEDIQPQEPVMVEGIPVLPGHLAHANGLLSCFLAVRANEGAPGDVGDWSVGGNFLRRTATLQGSRAVQTPSQLRVGGWQADLALLHYPKGKHAFGLEFSVWHKVNEGEIATLWYVIHGAGIIGGRPVLQFFHGDRAAIVELPRENPGAVVHSGEAFRIKMIADVTRYYLGQIIEVEEMTDCRPMDDGGCDRIPASDEQKIQRRTELVADHREELTRIGLSHETMYVLAKRLYPLLDPACRIYSPSIPQP